MIFTGRSFNIIYQNQQTKVEVYKTGKREVLKVLLSDPLYITKSVDADTYDFWTSLPQGRQKLAEEIGEIIDQTEEKRKKDNNSFQTSLF